MMRVLLPMLLGILLHPMAKHCEPSGVIESPVTSVTKRLIIYVCKNDLSIFVIEYFSIEGMWHQYRKQWLLLIFREMFLKCFMA